MEEKYEAKYSTIKGICSIFKIKTNRPKDKPCCPITYTKIRDMEEEFKTDWIDGVLSIQEMEDKYECPLTNLATRARKFNLKRKRSADKIDIDEVIKKYNNGDSIRSLSKENHIDQNKLKEILNNFNVVFRNPSQRCEKMAKDENYFDILDDQNKLYILGLLYADGCNHINRYMITLSLKEEDKYILEKIKVLMKSEREIKDVINKTYNRNYPTLIISNKKLSLRLAELGMVQNKSLILTYPNFLINNEMFRHFLRGYIDGDGSISCSIRDNNKYNIGITILGTFDFLNHIQAKLIELFGINKTKISKRNNIHSISIAQRYKVEEILDWLYLDANLYLTRKYDKYINIKEFNKLHPMKNKPPKYYSYLNNEQILLN